MLSALSTNLEAILDRFANAWNGPEPPCLDDFLPPPGTPHRLPLLIELVRIDLEHRRQCGSISLGDYLSRFPELDADAAIDLIVHEANLRHQSEPLFSPLEYLERFPAYGTQLQARLHELLAEWTTQPTVDSVPAKVEESSLHPWQLAPGTQLGSYRLLQRLGGGGMGEVFRACHVLLKKEVALKVLSQRLTCQAGAAERFRREMLAAGRLEHENLVRASDAGAAGDVLFLVMELIDGEDLAKVTQRCRVWPIAEACEAIRQAAVGLQHAHERSLVHRDIKPSNLMLTRTGAIKVLDLGLARLCADEGAAAATDSLTGSGRMMGSPNFVAPEQILDSHSADIRADLYSLGCTLFHLLLGEAPFDDPNYSSISQKLEAHLKEPPPDVRARRPDVPVELTTVLKRLLAKRPEDRYAVPAEVAAVLEPLAAGARLMRMFHGEGPSTLPLPAPKPRRRRRAALIGGLAGILLLAAAGWFGLGRTSSSSGESNSARAELTIRMLRVHCFEDTGANHQHLGEMGENTLFHLHKGNVVEVEAELSEPAYVFLLAFNPTDKAEGQTQLCWPDDEQLPPQRVRKLTYPSGGARLRLDDGVGLQALALAASRQPLPAYAQWRKQAAAFSWKKVAATSGYVWHGDGLSLQWRTQQGTRAAKVEMPERELLNDLGRWLRSAPGIEMISLMAFAVDP